MSIRYSYRLIPLSVMVAIAACSSAKRPDSFLSDDAEAQMLREALEGGYRWVHTSGEYAVFERVDGHHAKKIAKDVIDIMDDMHITPGCRFSGKGEITCPACIAQDNLAPLAGISVPTKEEGSDV